MLSFAQDIDQRFNLNFKCELDDWTFIPSSWFDDIDLSKIDQRLVMDRSRHLKGVDECLRVFAFAQEDWSTYPAIKSTYYIAVILLKFTELEILDQLYEKRLAGLGAMDVNHFYYPAVVLWKTRSFIIEKSGLVKATKVFEGDIIEKPKNDMDLDYYGFNIGYNIKMLITASKFINRFCMDDLGYFKSLIEMTVEVLENITVKC